MYMHSARKVPLGRPVVNDFFNIDGAERALARRFFDGVRRKADDAGYDEERAAILPRDSQVGDDAGNHSVDVRGEPKFGTRWILSTRCEAPVRRHSFAFRFMQSPTGCWRNKCIMTDPKEDLTWL